MRVLAAVTLDRIRETVEEEVVREGLRKVARPAFEGQGPSALGEGGVARQPGGWRCRSMITVSPQARDHVDRQRTYDEGEESLLVVGCWTNKVLSSSSLRAGAAAGEW